MVLSVAEALTLIAGALERSRTAPENAAAVAKALVAAELVGQGGHGLRRVAAYAAQAAGGKVDGFAVPTLTATRAAVLAVDAANG
ncbi:MAG: Ldh family oxidoreductase, partial [Devosia sp.]|nr:Ldh family oxidoreductase [Devosia sp.]